MTTSNYITFILLAVIGLVFLIDIILNLRKKPLEKSVEKFAEKEDAKKSWLNVKTFFWAYPFLIVFSLPCYWLLSRFLAGRGLQIEKVFDSLKSDFEGGYIDWFTFLFYASPFFLLHFLWFINIISDNWILKRKKNITLSLVLVSFIKVLVHYFFYTESFDRGWYKEGGRLYRNQFKEYHDFSWHLDNVFRHDLNLFIPVIIVYVVLIWFFNDKIKAR